MRKFKYILILLFVLCLVSCSKQDPQLLIRVINSENSFILKDAHVFLYESYDDWLDEGDDVNENYQSNEAEYGLTNEFGEVCFKNLKPIKYYIHVVYINDDLGIFTNTPLGIFATESELQIGNRNVLNIAVYNIDNYFN